MGKRSLLHIPRLRSQIPTTRFRRPAVRNNRTEARQTRALTICLPPLRQPSRRPPAPAARRTIVVCGGSAIQVQSQCLAPLPLAVPGAGAGVPRPAPGVGCSPLSHPPIHSSTSRPARASLVPGGQLATGWWSDRRSRRRALTPKGREGDAFVPVVVLFSLAC